MPSYLEGNLDPQRKEAMDDFLSRDAGLKKDFENLKQQVEYLEEISSLEPAPDLIEFIEKKQEGLDVLIKKYGWSQWSATTQWASQLAAVGIVLALTIHLFPWLNLARTLKTPKTNFAQLKNTPADEDSQMGARVTYGPLWPKDFPSPEQYALQAEETKKKDAQIADIVAKSDEEDHGTEVEEGEEAAVHREGFVWRGVLKVNELNNETAQKITNQIIALGGAKAGQVELGWVKGDTRYYHFTVPIGKYTEFQSFMNEQGHLILKKEKHPRVMKEGIMRIIMSVESSK